MRPMQKVLLPLAVCQKCWVALPCDPCLSQHNQSGRHNLGPKDERLQEAARVLPFTLSPRAPKISQCTILKVGLCILSESAILLHPFLPAWVSEDFFLPDVFYFRRSVIKERKYRGLIELPSVSGSNLEVQCITCGLAPDAWVPQVLFFVMPISQLFLTAECEGAAKLGSIPLSDKN